MTISGQVTSSKPVSLAKASSVLKAFTAADTGASEALNVFLRRSSAAFIELVQFHRDLNAGKPERNQKVADLEENGEKRLHLDGGERLGVTENGGGGCEEELGGKKMKKNKKKRREGLEVKVEEERREMKKNKKKRREGLEVKVEEERREMKKNKKKRREGLEVEEVKVEEERRERKKRKKAEDSEERSSRKKKRRHEGGQ